MNKVEIINNFIYDRKNSGYIKVYNFKVSYSCSRICMSSFDIFIFILHFKNQLILNEMSQVSTNLYDWIFVVYLSFINQNWNENTYKIFLFDWVNATSNEGSKSNIDVDKFLEQDLTTQYTPTRLILHILLVLRQ